MAKSAEQKAVDDAVKAYLTVEKNAQRVELANERLLAANSDLVQATKVLKWNLAHPALPEDFDVEQHLDAPEEEPFDEPEPEAEAIPEPEATPEAEPEPKPAPKAKAKAAPAPQPEPEATENPFEDSPFG